METVCGSAQRNISYCLLRCCSHSSKGFTTVKMARAQARGPCEALALDSNQAAKGGGHKQSKDELPFGEIQMLESLHCRRRSPRPITAHNI